MKGRAPAKGEGGEGWARHHDARASTPITDACVLLPQHLQCESARRVTGMGAPPQACPPHCKRVFCDGVRCMQPPVRLPVVLRLTLNKQ